MEERSGVGAFIGFLVGLVGGIVIVYYIYPSLDLDDAGPFFIFIFYAVVIIGLLSILGAIIGAIIGYFFGEKIYKVIAYLFD
jgi:branched-subunit amino acid ABC-type transport system permease component